ncbi:hypothetical protein PENTCL1PPCAC_9304, partial [Pristionchus entomophagus]
PDCSVNEIKDPRLYMAVGGTSLSVVSLFCNSLIAIVLMRSKHTHFFFFALLAVSDTFLSVMYGPVIAMEIIKDVFREVWLNRIFWSYMPSLLTACNISMTFSTFLIILATTERFMITIKSDRLRWFRTHRGLLAGCALFLACLLKGGMFWEFVMLPNDPCRGTLLERELALTNLSLTVSYGKVFKFYLRNICTVLFPFIFLIFLNLYIVITLRKQQRAAALFRFATSRHKIDTRTMTNTKLQVRSATRLTVLIVCSFLVSNALNVAFTVVEFWDMDLLMMTIIFQMYEYGTDFVSVMYILVCATRLLVYVACNEEIRDEVHAFLCGRRYNRKGFMKQSNSNSKGASELDSIALTIARRLISSDLTETATMNDEESSDPHDGSNGKTVVIANGYTHCNTDDV